MSIPSDSASCCSSKSFCTCCGRVASARPRLRRAVDWSRAVTARARSPAAPALPRPLAGAGTTWSAPDASSARSSCVWSILSAAAAMLLSSRPSAVGSRMCTATSTTHTTVARTGRTTALMRPIRSSGLVATLGDSRAACPVVSLIPDDAATWQHFASLFLYLRQFPSFPPGRGRSQWLGARRVWP